MPLVQQLTDQVFPASRAALFGIRPSTGLISTEGVVPVSSVFLFCDGGCAVLIIRSVLDAVGPMGFTTRDTAILLDVLTYNDGRDVKPVVGVYRS
jgi:amidase